jgi:SpoIID/LytB domain protein
MDHVLKRARSLALLFAVSGFAVLLAGPAVGEPDYSFEGAGWGHGLGLSQYGAKAMAADSASYEEILSRYFPSTLLVPFEIAAAGTFLDHEEKPLWVGLLQGVDTVSFSVASGSAELCFDDGREACTVSAVPGESWRFAHQGGGACAFMRIPDGGSPYVVGPAGPCEASVRPSTEQAKLNLPYKARTYSHGILRLREDPDTEGFHVVYQIGIDDFLRGLSEVPETWPMAAIEAQVVASRSNALWYAEERGSGTSLDAEYRVDCFCNLRDDASDQIFRGYTGEISHPHWVAAVATTARQVMMHGGGLTLGMYSSSSGGWTDSFLDVFNSPEHPYLAAVLDSPAFSDLAENPHKEWVAGFDQELIAEAYEFSWVHKIEVVDWNQSGSVSSVRVSGIRNGWPVEQLISGTEFRDTFSLRSTTFEISSFSQFTDVPSSHTFAGEILGLSELRITLGCGSQQFCPNESLTRSEMAALIVRALGLDLITDNDTFIDDDGHFFEDQIETIYHNGISLGCANNRYCPDERITRSEVAAFITRSYSLPTTSQNVFVDSKKTGLEAEIEAVAATGIIAGCTTNMFCPESLVTRGEVAAYLIRARAN